MFFGVGPSASSGLLHLRRIQLLHLNQPGVEHLIRHLADRQTSALGHAHKGSLDVRVE